MLNWIYQVEIENVNEVAIDLYHVADKYDIGLLKKYCANFMGEHLSDENFPSRLILAYKFSEEHLKKFIIDFLQKGIGNLKVLMASKEWIEFAHGDFNLAKKIVDDIFG